MTTKSLKKDTENDILEAAKKIFIEKGFAGARMQAIADEAKINKAMLHYYFRSKEVLFGRIMDGAVEIMAAEFGPVLMSEGSVMEKVERLINGYTKAILQNPYIPMFVINELSQNSTQYQDRIRAKFESNGLFSNFITQIESEQKAGILKPIGVEHFVITLMSLLVFPFVAKPVFQQVLALSEEGYASILEERKALILQIIKSSLVN